MGVCLSCLKGVNEEDDYIQSEQEPLLPEDLEDFKFEQQEADRNTKLNIIVQSSTNHYIDVSSFLQDPLQQEQQLQQFQQYQQQLQQQQQYDQMQQSQGQLSQSGYLQQQPVDSPQFGHQEITDADDTLQDADLNIQVLDSKQIPLNTKKSLQILHSKVRKLIDDSIKLDTSNIGDLVVQFN